MGRRSWWLIPVVLGFLALSGTAVWAETLTVARPDQKLYPDPDFAGTPLAPVPEGAEVQVLKQAGDWYKVEYGGTSGWIHRQAFPTPKTASPFSLKHLLTGPPVQETKSDEVALAGKGFTPEVESAYRQKHPDMNFAMVDQMESFRVDEARLQKFIQEGGLTP